MKYRLITAAAFGLAAAFVSAQVEVVDRKIPSQKTSSNNSSISNTTEMYYQMQVLQQEVLQLRGMVEQQAHEIKKLKQQQLDDYVDLDRRVSQLSTGAMHGGNTSDSVPASTNSGSALSSTSSAAPNAEMAKYRTAMDLILKKNDYDRAVIALNEYIKEFPSGRYSANAHYWLGEVYLKKGDLNKAKDSFSKVVGEYSDSRKVSDAQYKLGIVYHQLGDPVTARKFLRIVAETSTDAARLARQYLDNNL